MAARDSNGAESVWRLGPCPTLLFVSKAGELDAKHDQDLRDTCVMLLDRAGYFRYLVDIKLVNVRAFKGQKISFDFPETAVIGTNGGGGNQP
jgi:hypothetical protein